MQKFAKRILHRNLIVTIFDDGRDHFKPHVRLDGVSNMGRNDKGFSDFQEVRLVLNHDFRLSINDLNKGFERRNLFSKGLTRVERHGRYVPGRFADNGLDYNRIWNVFQYFNDNKGFCAFNFYVWCCHDSYVKGSPDAADQRDIP